MKKVSILAICFIGLAAFVYFYEIGGEESRNNAKEMEESLFRLETDQILEVVIEPVEKEPVRILKQGEDWMLKQPIETFADSGTLDTFLNDITSSKRDRIFEDAALKLAEYGLEDPRNKVIISTTEMTRELLIGDKDFTGSQVYVKFADSTEVFLTDDSLLTSLENDLTD